MKWGLFKRKQAYYPADRYSKDYIKEMLQVTGKYEVSRIPAIFELLLTSSNELKVRAAKVLHAYVQSLNILELSKLDNLFRERTSLDWAYDWKTESPENLLTTDMTEEMRVMILGLCSFHPNGYFREKALHLLDQHDSGKELTYLLIRCNDWVIEVRDTARKYVERRLKHSYVKNIVNNLPLLFKLKNTNRNDNSKVFEQVVHILSQKESFPFLDEGTKSNFGKIRYFCYKMIISSKVYDKELLFNYLKLEKEPHLRLLLFNELINDISVDEFKLYYPTLEKDKFPMIRAKVLEKYYSFFPDESIKELEKALLDKNGTIRSIARFILSKQNKFDFASYYIRMLKTDQFLRGAILGLGEVGKKDHVEMIIPYLDNSDVSIVKAAIRSISLLDVENHKAELVGLLGHKHEGISKTARKSLSTVYDKDLKDQLYSLYTETHYKHTKYNIALLLSSLSKWYAIIYIIEFYVNEEESEISRLGKANFNNWIVNFNRTFDLPTKNQIVSIKNTLLKYGNKLEKSDVKEIEFCIKGFQ
ncbi:HEAT repeat domain-containing protein [Rummeliibacillus sp. TYF005]|uniref:HEAT repeat domain-containing protein n=1 Tax=Rummeliibacillus sp. TYF005 TaxID=2058214 RepID=UPI000F521A17|nr:HEAT repeat domain-containing protein [Rummeliibacillus sp. TYF005]RPJ94799.1 HEAT repeat domain-containing protein [Rummeliibacillus sp. TYF005]